MSEKGDAPEYCAARSKPTWSIGSLAVMYWRSVRERDFRKHGSAGVLMPDAELVAEAERLLGAKKNTIGVAWDRRDREWLTAAPRVMRQLLDALAVSGEPGEERVHLIRGDLGELERTCARMHHALKMGWNQAQYDYAVAYERRNPDHPIFPATTLATSEGEET